jgi:hypothetical protein
MTSWTFACVTSAFRWGLEERLGNVVADEALDDQLCSVEIPVSVLTGTHNIPYVRRRSQLRQWALAASLMMMVGAGVIGLLGVVVSSVRLVEPPPLALMVVAQGPLDIVSPLEPAVTILPAADDGRWQPSLVGLSDETMRLLTTFDRPQLGPAGQLAEDFGKVWNPWDNWLLMRWGGAGVCPGHRCGVARVERAHRPGGARYGSAAGTRL